jgi:hypothetical protein
VLGGEQFVQFVAGGLGEGPPPRRRGPGAEERLQPVQHVGQFPGAVAVLGRLRVATGGGPVGGGADRRGQCGGPLVAAAAEQDVRVEHRGPAGRQVRVPGDPVGGDQRPGQRRGERLHRPALDGARLERVGQHRGEGAGPVLDAAGGVEQVDREGGRVGGLD